MKVKMIYKDNYFTKVFEREIEGQIDVLKLYHEVEHHYPDASVYEFDNEGDDTLVITFFNAEQVILSKTITFLNKLRRR